MPDYPTRTAAPVYGVVCNCGGLLFIRAEQDHAKCHGCGGGVDIVWPAEHTRCAKLLDGARCLRVGDHCGPCWGGGSATVLEGHTG